MRLRALRGLTGKLPPPPLQSAADARWSAIGSATDLYTRPNDQLVQLLLSAAEAARHVDLSSVAERSTPEEAAWILQWPGEHYRLLAGVAAVLRPDVVIEIGTFKGHSALSLVAGAPRTRVITYDIIPWQDIPGTALSPADFDQDRIEQRVGDLGDATYLESELDTLRSAALVFIDGPKDGSWEQHALPMILRSLEDRERVVILDDINLLAMVQLWRDLPYAKLDATSFGHWSGTGLLKLGSPSRSAATAKE